MTQKKKKTIIVILSIVITLSVAISAYLIIKGNIEETGIAQMEENILDYVIESPIIEPTEEPDNPDDFTNDADWAFDWDKLLRTNSDVIGWIRFDNPDRINYPIVQRAGSNQYYLNRDWTGAYRSSGAIFLHKDNAPNFTDMNSIIYGHRMNRGSMFGGLTKYQSQSFMNNNPYFYIYTPDGQKRTYEAFVFAEVQDGSDVYSSSFPSKEDKLSYFDMMYDKAILPTVFI